MWRTRNSFTGGDDWFGWLLIRHRLTHQSAQQGLGELSRLHHQRWEDLSFNGGIPDTMQGACTTQMSGELPLSNASCHTPTLPRDPMSISRRARAILFPVLGALVADG